MNTKPTQTENSIAKMSKEDIAFVIKTLWNSLLKPDWERGDLIDLGMAVFTKVPLSKLDPRKFSKLLPFLSIVAEDLGNAIHNHLMKEVDAYVASRLATEIPVSTPISTPSSTEAATSPSPSPTETPEIATTDPKKEEANG